VLSCTLARVIFADRADLIVITFIHEEMAVGAKIFVFGNAWATNIEKSHGIPLVYYYATTIQRCVYIVDKITLSHTA
jgi:hypothetical protein